MGAVNGAQFGLKMVTSATMKPPKTPPIIHGMGAPGTGECDKPQVHAAVATTQSRSRPLDGDAFDSWQKKLDRAAIDDPRLYDDSFIGDGHFRGAAPHETNAEKNRGYKPKGNAHPSQRAGKRSSSGVYSACRGKERGRTHQREDGGDQSMPHHDDPVQPGLVLYGFARDEMLFGVAQMGSLKKGVSKLAIGEAAAD